MIDPKLAAIEAQILPLIWGIFDRQEAYLDAQGEYLQMLSSNDPPEAGQEVEADLKKKPKGQALAPKDLFDHLPASLPCEMTIVPYVAPAGAGFEIIARVKLGGKVWKKSWQRGPEKFRAQDWAEE